MRTQLSRKIHEVSGFCYLAVLCLVAQSCPTLCDAIDYSPPGSSVHGDSPGKNTGVGCHALLQEILWTQGSNSGLLPCKQILYCLSHQGSPGILEWVAYPFSRGCSTPRDQTRVSCITGRFFTSWATQKVPCCCDLFILSLFFLILSFFLMSRRLSASTSHPSIYSRMLSLLLEMTYLSSQILGICTSTHPSFHLTLRAPQPMFLYMSLSQFISPLSLKNRLLLPMLKSHCSLFCNPNRNVFIQFEGWLQLLNCSQIRRF